MSNPLALAMLKSFIGPEQIEALEKLTQELMRALGTIQEMDARLKHIELCIDPSTPPSNLSKDAPTPPSDLSKDAPTPMPMNAVSGRHVYGILNGE